ncbi:hypothetical protein [Roseibium sediminis]|uniref:hypothetical protein n=1 Tax=Roseibium sediminis TaxID=1775174 RepID=UPI00123DC1F8|nr:hypothetical protein [Roseibium sediminis]
MFSINELDASQTLILKPDPYKARLIVFFAVAAGAVAGFICSKAFLPGLEGSLLVPALVSALVAAGVYFGWAQRFLIEQIILSSTGFTYRLGGKDEFYSWKQVSRFTLIEYFRQDRYGRRADIGAVYLAFRKVDQTVSDDEREDETNEFSSDREIAIGQFVAQHKYSSRNPVEEFAASSAETFVEIVNLWRDTALKREPRSTPYVVVEDNGIAAKWFRLYRWAFG